MRSGCVAVRCCRDCEAPAKTRLTAQISPGTSEAGFQQRFEQLAMIGQAQMRQFFHNHAFAKAGVLAKQAGVKSHPACRRAASPLSFHRPHVDHLWAHADALGPGLDFRLKEITRNRFFQRLPLFRRGVRAAWAPKGRPSPGALSAVPSGRGAPWDCLPSVETLGYCRMSLRDRGRGRSGAPRPGWDVRGGSALSENSAVPSGRGAP